MEEQQRWRTSKGSGGCVKVEGKWEAGWIKVERRKPKWRKLVSGIYLGMEKKVVKGSGGGWKGELEEEPRK